MTPPNATGTQRGRWALPLVEAATGDGAGTGVEPDDGPPTEPTPVTAPDPLASSTRLVHLGALDGLRGVAVVAVVMYHFSPSVAPGGFLGVDLFFVLSGFLITSLLVNEWEGTNRIALGAFWGRRARRLLPALLLVLAVVGAYTLFLGSQVDAEHIAEDGLSAFTYIANWHFISTGQSYIQHFVHSAPSPLRHMWSLAIEEQFYLLWPLLVLGVAALVRRSTRRPERRRHNFRTAVIVTCLTLGALSFVRMIALFHAGSGFNRVYYGTDSRAFIILIGAALGAVSSGAPTIGNPRARTWLIGIGCAVAVGLLAVMATTATSSRHLYEGMYGVIALGMVVVLAAAAQPGNNPLARTLKWRPIVGLGLISYGIYLWHWPVSIWVTQDNFGVGGIALFAVRTALTLGAALASYYLVEQPIRRGRLPGSFLANRGVVPMALVTAVAVVLLVPAIAFPSVRAIPTTGGTSESAIATTAQYAAAPRCDNEAPAQPIASGRTVKVQLVGNSIAQEIRSCLGTILAARGGALGGTSPYGFSLCKLIPRIRKEIADPGTKPDVAVWFALASLDSGCGPDWRWQITVRQLVTIWREAGMHIYLVPAIGVVDGVVSAGKHPESTNADRVFYENLARKYPADVTVLDAGTFLRDQEGVYQWRMPCLPGEPGCDTNKTMGVRWTDGFHYCADPEFGSNENACPRVEDQAGERRAAAGMAAALLPKLASLGAP